MKGYAPLRFNDFGADAQNPLGFNFEKGNAQLQERKKQFIAEFSPVVLARPWTNGAKEDLLRAVEQEKAWQILQHLTGRTNVMLGERRQDMPKDTLVRSLGAMAHHFGSVVDLFVNSALYTSQPGGAPGYFSGHQIVLEESRYPDSPIYNLVNPEFQKRLVNGSFWEKSGSSDKKLELLEKVLTDFAPQLDVSFSEEGWRIFDYVSPPNRRIDCAHRFQLTYLSNGAVRNFGQFAGKLVLKCRDTMNFQRTMQFLNCFVKPYFEALEHQDEEGKRKFNPSEAEYLRKVKGLEDFDTALHE